MALMEEQPPSIRPRGQKMRRLFSPESGSVQYAQSRAVRKS
jgi:hypothetical protein